jgi:5,10-methylenetetrahydromethanopterin reductase
MMGIKRQHSARALREAVTIMKRLLAGEEVTLQGEMVRAHQARLQFKPARAPLLWVATRGDVTLKTAGEYADGIIIATYATPEAVAEALAMVDQGLARAGRSRGDVRLMSRVDTCVHADYRAAYAGMRTMISRVLWVSYPDRNFVRRLGLVVPAEMEELIARRDINLIPRLVELLPDDFVRAFAWAGSPEMIVERVVAIARRTGIREFGFWLLLAPGQSREEAARLLAAEVAPAVRAALGA